MVEALAEFKRRGRRHNGVWALGGGVGLERSSWGLSPTELCSWCNEVWNGFRYLEWRSGFILARYIRGHNGVVLTAR